MDEKNYLLWLSNIKGIGIARITALLDFFETATNIFNSNYKILLDSGLPRNVISAIIEAKEISPETYINLLKEKQIDYFTINCEMYPDQLRHIPSPPPVIYVKGNLPPIHFPIIAVVGSRRASEYGTRQTLEISKKLATHGVVIASGMAKGIDSFAHKGALDADGITLAVLGCGVDHCYPAENKNIYDKIPQKGAIISEYFPGTTPLAGHFPMRNRIISGLSDGILVTEASPNSGSLITVERALDQGRDVFALPGNVTSKLSSGTNNLIKQGAALITSADDILEILGIKTQTSENTEKKENVIKNLAEDEKLVYDCIHSEPIDINGLLQKLSQEKITLQQLQYLLTMLELKNYINRLPGGRFVTTTA